MQNEGSTPPVDVEALRARIPALQRCVYLNSGTSGPLPAVVTARVRELLAREAAEGPAVPEVWQAGIAEVVAAKAALARLLNADPEELALTQNATQGLTLVAGGYPWQPGDEILTTDEEHVSGLVPWYGLARHRGVRVRLLPVDPDPEVTVRTFAEAMGPATRLLAFSHVSYCTGVRLPARELCRLARAGGALSAVDGAQAVGAIPVDLHDLACDFYALPGQKWLLGPDGTGAFYARGASLDRLQPPALGWASVSGYDLEGNYTLFPSARRFETATASIPLVGGLRTAVELAAATGMDAIADRIAALAARLKTRLTAIPGVALLTPMPAERSAGLVSVTHPRMNPDVAAARLWKERRILCRSIPDPHCLRFAVHAFNTEAEVDAAAEAVGEGVRG